MLDQVVVLHNSQRPRFSRFNGRWVPWQTCLRRVAFGRHTTLNSQNIHPDTQVLLAEGLSICIRGGLWTSFTNDYETEVYGQFKQLLDGVVSDKSSDVFIRQWLEDV